MASVSFPMRPSSPIRPCPPISKRLSIETIHPSRKRDWPPGTPGGFIHGGTSARDIQRLPKRRNRTAEDFDGMPVTLPNRTTRSKSRKPLLRKRRPSASFDGHDQAVCRCHARIPAGGSVNGLTRCTPPRIAGVDHDHRLGCDADSSPRIVASLRWDLRRASLKHRAADVAPIDFRAECQGVLLAIGGRIRPMRAGCDGQCGANTGCASIVYAATAASGFLPLAQSEKRHSSRKTRKPSCLPFSAALRP